MSPEGTPTSIRRAGVEDVDRLAPLFDAYRGFYGLPADLALSRRYLRERLARNEAVILLAESTAPRRPEHDDAAAAPRPAAACVEACAEACAEASASRITDSPRDRRARRYSRESARSAGRP